MSEPPRRPASHWTDAEWVAALFAVAPSAVGGVALRAHAGPARDHWIAQVRALLPQNTPMRFVPLSIAESRLIGGLDLAATLRAGRALADRGLLVDINHGVAVITSAERMPSRTASLIAQTMESGEVILERDGLTLRTPTTFGVIALDEAYDADEVIPAVLLDRLAFRLDLDSMRVADMAEFACTARRIAQAQARFDKVPRSAEAARALCAAAWSLGIDSFRAPLLALNVARAACALSADANINDDHIALAARLVLLPRAQQLPVAPDEAEANKQEQSDSANQSQTESNGDPNEQQQSLDDLVLEAARAALPEDLLRRLKQSPPQRMMSQRMGRMGVAQRSNSRGRPAGVRPGDPRTGARLNVIETLRAAAPWQRLRTKGFEAGGVASIQVRREDFRVMRYKRNTETTTIFVVDASGSSALHRLAEAKGAVELMLAECYIRRDRVALIAFRGRQAELLLAPTRSLARAKRTLAGLPGGGGTPLAAGLDAALQLSESVRRRGGAAVVIVLTDGRANVARDGGTDKVRAETEATNAARALAVAQLTAVVVDTSPRPQPQSRKLAADMGATYLPLPHADAATMSNAIRVSTQVGATHPR